MEQLPGKYFHGSITIEEGRMIDEWYESPGSRRYSIFGRGNIEGKGENMEGGQS